MAHSFDSYVYEGEQVLWNGVVSRKVLFFFAVLYATLLRLVYNWVGGLSAVADQTASLDSAQHLLGLPFIILGLFFAVRFYGLFLKRFVITDKRALLISGIIGVDVVALAYPQIQNASLDVGLIGMVFGVGDILIDSGKIHSKRIGKQTSTETKYDIFQYVASPKEVYAFLQTGLLKK